MDGVAVKYLSLGVGISSIDDIDGCWSLAVEGTMAGNRVSDSAMLVAVDLSTGKECKVETGGVESVVVVVVGVVAFVAPRDVIGRIELMRGIAAAVLCSPGLEGIKLGDSASTAFEIVFKLAGCDSVKDLVDES